VTFIKGHKQFNTGRTHWEKGRIPWNKNQFNKTCLLCKNIFIVSPYRKDSAKYCSRICRAKAIGIKNRGINNVNWKGTNVGYQALHTWVKRNLGKASVCVFCATLSAKKYEWANVSHEYKRELTDWMSLCTKCHNAYDDIINRGWATRREQECA
jgi:hypothetical protein